MANPELAYVYGLQEYPYYRGNCYLTDEQMQVNARCVALLCTGLGFTMSAIAGMLGNMQVESSINPAIWQDLNGNPPYTSRGYGLVQWTPATKFIDWCTNTTDPETGRPFDPMTMEAAISRIRYEAIEGLQWIATDAYPFTFEEFLTSGGNPRDKAMQFLACYERPADPYQPIRGEYAARWYEYLTGEPVPPITPPTTSKKSKKMPLWLLLAATRRD